MKNKDIVWQPSDAIIENSNLRIFMHRWGIADLDELIIKADAEPEWFWDAVIEYGKIEFTQSYEKVMDTSRDLPWTSWCIGGRTNFTLQCIEKHRDNPDRVCLIAEDEDGNIQELTQARLEENVARFAGALRSSGIRKGDTVGVYMPMLPAVAVTFLAIARLGAVVVPLFSGFGSEAIVTRLQDANARVLIAAKSFKRRGKEISTLSILDEVKSKLPAIDKIILFGTDIPGEYLSWNDLIATAEPLMEPVIVEADAPLLLVYTSGTSGRPKGAVLTHCGFPAKMALDLQLCLDLKPSDRWLWMSDFGWVIGPIMIGGALMTGCTLIMADGAPDHPEEDRIWRLLEKYGVSFFGVAPTLIRAQMQKSQTGLLGYDLDTIRIVVSSGELWTNESWHWCFDNVCRRNAPIINWSGGTEISGAILTGTVVQALKPLSFTAKVPGMGVDVVNGSGEKLGANQVGELVLRNPSIGLTKSLWNDDQRYLETYWSEFGTLWRHGDLVSYDEDGFWFLHGRSDDVLKIGGKRTGPSEIESLVLNTGLVTESAVVGLPDDKAGQVVACVCVRTPGDDEKAEPEIEDAISQAVVDGMGKPYKPRIILFVNDLPRTRSGKVIRRVIAAILAGREPGDISTLASLDAITELKEKYESRLELKQDHGYQADKP